MRKVWLLLLIIHCETMVFSQQDSSQLLFADELVATIENSLPGHTATSLLNDLKKKLTTDPDLYNRVWARIMEIKDKSKALTLFRDLDVEFKTFEIEKEDLIGLGFKYDWNFDWRRFQKAPLKRNGFSFQIQSNGNVAFKKH